jgi:phosphoribosyl 1,2-cyclic phosphodiesterase
MAKAYTISYQLWQTKNMMYASLASGSKGNCHAVGDGGRILLIDAGISLRQIRSRLDGLNWRHEDVRGVAVSHEHSDHINAIPIIIKHTDWPILATPSTLKAIEAAKGIEIPKSRWIPLTAGRALNWDGWLIHPFSVPHDAADPVGYRVEAPGLKMAVITDLGYPTTLTVDYSRGLDLLVLESNHDVGMLREGSYPPVTKARILSRVGHLSNDACAEMLLSIISPALKHIVLAHLSEQNNDPALARLTSLSAINQTNSCATLHVASQGEAIEAPLAV